MDHITIPIPEGMDETQKAALAGWLSQKVAEVTPENLPCEDDPAWQAEASARIKQGLAEIEAGQGVDAHQAMREIADELGAVNK